MRHRIKGPRWEIEKNSSRYPKSLLDLRNPPEKLYLIGDYRILENGLSIIGARKATPYGLSCAELFGKEAALHEIVVVSGGALGCDSSAHRGALKAGGKTVVVLGGGCDQPYPVGNASLFQEVVDSGGALISEHPWDFRAKPYCFRMRNRLIAALSKAVLIVEAGLPSGTFSTADEALAINREVLVVPGSIMSDSSAGSNQLLYQGAMPIVSRESFEDALVTLYDCLRFCSSGRDSGSASSIKKSSKKEKNDPFLEALLASPMRIEEMLSLKVFIESGKEQNGASEIERMNEIIWRVSMLEQEGRITRYPDGRYGPVVRF
ncbi:MAG: DNA-processing protein DprA [Anaerotardibacter sp.]